MSRIGRQIIMIPEKTEVVENDGSILVKGPLGELKKAFRSEILFDIKDKEVTLKPVKETLFGRALWGTYASHLKNMIDGVNKKFEKKLIVEGVGYRVRTENKKLILNLGFSHPVEVSIPEDLDVTVEKNLITISGINKETVGSFTSSVRSLKKPEPYKGKGIRYEDEVVRRKQGKKAA